MLLDVPAVIGRVRSASRHALISSIAVHPVGHGFEPVIGALGLPPRALFGGTLLLVCGMLLAWRHRSTAPARPTESPEPGFGQSSEPVDTPTDTGQAVEPSDETVDNPEADDRASLLAHDLRNQLTVATFQTEQEQERLSQDGYQRLVLALDRMEQLIEDELRTAPAGETIDRTDCSIATVARTSWEHVDTERATLQIQGDLLIRADESKLSRLFENLFRNSIEHGMPERGSAQPSALTISVGPVGSRGFYVADDGTGFADPERVFKRGYSTAPEGTGLGLTIVERVVSAHGWNIAVASADEAGARYEITSVEASPDRTIEGAVASAGARTDSSSR